MAATLLSLTEEVIDFQMGDSIVQELNALFEDIKDEMSSNEINATTEYFDTDAGSKKINILENLLTKRFGLVFKLNPSDFGEIYISSPLPGINNVLHNFKFTDITGLISSKDIKKIKKNLADITKSKIEVDLSKAKIKNYPSKLDNQVYIDLYMFLSFLDLTPGEVTAILLHEVGHAFNYIEMFNRTVKTNAIITNTVKAVGEGKDTKKFTLEFRDLLDSDEDKKEFDNLGKPEMTPVWLLGYYKLFFKGFESLVPGTNFHLSYNETYADVFAARFNLGKELVTGLNTLNDKELIKSYKEVIKDKGPKPNIVVRILQAIILAYVAIFILFYALLISGFALSALVSHPVLTVGFGLLMMSVFGGEVNKELTYRDLKDRYTAIKQQSIEALKQTDISKEDKLGLIDSIKRMDEIISNLDDHENIVLRLINVINPVNRSYKFMHELEKTLEYLVNNDLFVKEAELRILG